MDGDDGAETGAAADAENARVGERILEGRLEGSAGAGQRRPDQAEKQHLGQTQVQHDNAHWPGTPSALTDAHGPRQRLQDMLRRNRHCPPRRAQHRQAQVDAGKGHR